MATTRFYDWSPRHAVLLNRAHFGRGSRARLLNDLDVFHYTGVWLDRRVWPAPDWDAGERNRTDAPHLPEQ